MWHDPVVTEPDWQVLLARIDGFELQKPVAPDELTRAEASLGTALPAALRALYLATDGVYDKLGQWFVIWPLADLVERNSNRRILKESAPRRRLIGFGDDGTGHPFCVPRDGRIGVFLWSPILQEADRLAHTIEEFWAGWTAP
ncbi:hypothetical protein GCM10023107_34830 [Actinoplanes octamycinicus]|nr:hypothetical protein Aoc01nite_28050 [Actinoplanes octamycinicus]